MGPAPDEVADIETRLGETERQRDEYLGMLKLKAAEFENYQKRNAKERAEEQKYWTRALAADLLPALDNLDRALAAAGADSGPLAQGVAVTQRQLLDILARYGVKRMDVAIGTPLDPHEHEAVMQQPSATVPVGAITLILAPGYRIHDRVLRPASVGVSSGPPKE
jgi:molecular chaperone GrpE